MVSVLEQDVSNAEVGSESSPYSNRDNEREKVLWHWITLLLQFLGAYTMIPTAHPSSLACCPLPGHGLGSLGTAVLLLALETRASGTFSLGTEPSTP